MKAPAKKVTAKPRKPAKKAPVKSTLPSGNAGSRKWREQFNPLRGLTIKKAVTLLESAQRGEFADYQWTCRTIERRFPELSALISRRNAALMEMDFDIKVVAPEKPDAAMEALAEAQAVRLREVYEGIGNLYEAIETLAMADFREFGFCEKIINADGDLVELRPVDCWNMVRDGIQNRWKYNPDAFNFSYDSISGDELPLDRFVYRTVGRPLNEIALILFLRSNNANKSWDAFLDIYAVPGGVVTGPPNVAPADRVAFEQSAQDIAAGGSGFLPYGSSYEPNDGPRGVNPFTDALKHLSELLVLAGTGGKLTMLNDATGIGGSQGDVHADAFRQIAAAVARKINEIFQKQIDAAILDAEFPGQQHLAYFELNFREEVKAKDVVEMTSKLASAGLEADPDEISEKVGIRLTRKQQQEPVIQDETKAPEKAPKKEQLENREGVLDAAKAEALRAALPGMVGQFNPEFLALLEEVMGLAFLAGLQSENTPEIVL